MNPMDTETRISKILDLLQQEPELHTSADWDLSLKQKLGNRPASRSFAGPGIHFFMLLLLVVNLALLLILNPASQSKTNAERNLSLEQLSEELFIHSTVSN
ncbi:MAG: hypothetical protein U0X40_02810 [Ferruginibacter sp.]